MRIEHKSGYTLPQQDLPLKGKAAAIKLPERYLRLRFMFEVAIIVMASPFVLPLVLLLMLIVRLDSAGPSLYIQFRPGRNGLLFKFYKLRTMHVAQQGAAFRLTAVADHRITRFGRFLRKWRLDELPQLWNVLRGEMSIIGPRPVPADLYATYLAQIPDYELRHIILPGITGLAQVKLGYTDDLEGEKLKLTYDLQYLKNISAPMDVNIILETIKSFLLKRGVR